MKTECELFPPEFLAPALGNRVPACSRLSEAQAGTRKANEINAVPGVPAVPADLRGKDAALRAMAEAERRGARFRLIESTVYLRTPAGRELPSGLVERLRRHREEIARILEEDRRDAIEERAAILEFEAGLSRREAERRARAEHDGSAA